MDRQAYIKDFKSFIANSRENLKSICDNLGWSFESFCKKDDDGETRVPCPLEPESHRSVAVSRLDEHVERCRWTQQGLSKHQLPLPPVFTPGGPTITLSAEEQASVIQAAALRDPTIQTAVVFGIYQLLCSQYPFQISFFIQLLLIIFLL